MEIKPTKADVYAERSAIGPRESRSALRIVTVSGVVDIQARLLPLVWDFRLTPWPGHTNSRRCTSHRRTPVEGSVIAAEARSVFIGRILRRFGFLLER